MNSTPVSQPNARRNHRVPLIQIILERIPFYANALVALAGVAVLAEWMASALRIARLSEQYVPMAPATALCFVALGLGWLVERASARRPRSRALALGMTIGALGLRLSKGVPVLALKSIPLMKSSLGPPSEPAITPLPGCRL